MDDDAGLDRIWTAPNIITLVRLLCIPLFLWLLFGEDRQTLAAALLAAKAGALLHLHQWEAATATIAKLPECDRLNLTRGCSAR